MSDDRDPIVRRALEQMPVPEHGPDFWRRLEARLAEEPAPGDASESDAPGEPEAPASYEVPLERGTETVVPLRRRWERRGLWLGIAAALAVIAGAVALFAAGDRDEKLPAVTAPPTSDTTDVPEPLLGTTALGAVNRLIEAFAEADTDTAWSMLAPRSRDTWGSKANFEAVFTDLAEGYGSWIEADRSQEMTMALPSTADRRAEVVIIEGIREAEGTREHAVLSWPAYYEAVTDSYLIDAFGQPESAAPLEQIEPPRQPGGPAPMAADGTVTVRVDDPTAEVFFKLDEQGEQTTRQPSPDGVVEWRPERPLPSGNHLLGVAYFADDGSVWCLGIPLVVE